MDDKTYRSLDAVAMAELVAKGETTAPELLEAAQRRAAQVNPKLNAIVVDLAEQAQDQVAKPVHGPLAGVPFLLKDLGQDYAGVPTSWGSRSLSKIPAIEHSTIVQRWLDAGLVIFGKTNVPEFGAKGITEPVLFGAAHNPHDLNRTTGGSSGGSGAAVAGGIVPAAGANDGGGSIRIPASCCGLFGLKPSRGLVPWGPNSSEPMQGIATNGVLSWSVRDTAALLDACIGPDSASPFAPAMPESPFFKQLQTPPGKLKIGYHTESAINPNPDQNAIDAVHETAALLESLGHSVEEVRPPCDDAALARDFLTSWFAALGTQLRDIQERTGAKDDQFEDDTRIVAALGNNSSGTAVSTAIERRVLYIKELAQFFDQYDLLLTPTTAELPPRIGSFSLPSAQAIAVKLLLRTRTTKILSLVDSLVDQMVKENLSWVPFTQLANLTGRPAMSVPIYWSYDGLPLGSQFVARSGDDGTLLRLAAQLEQAKPWADRRPEVI